MTELRQIAIDRMERAHEELHKALETYLDKVNELMLDYELATDGGVYEDDCENIVDLVMPAYNLRCTLDDRKYRLEHPDRIRTNAKKNLSPKPPKA